MRASMSRNIDELHGFLDGDTRKGRAGFVFNALLAGLIVLNLTAVVLETLEPLSSQYASLFHGFLLFSIAAFTIEYLVRVLVCTRHRAGRYAHPITGRLRYLISPLALLDLLAILPFYLSMAAVIDLRFLRVFRLLWILKAMRYLRAMATLDVVLRRERGTLLTILVLLLSMIFAASTLVYFFERDVQPDNFGSIPHAMWWGIATLTTVGYGDVVPQSPLGKVLGGLIMLAGIAMFAMPAGILAAAFAEEAKRKNFIVTWNLVAHVPFFSHLGAREIARIVELLRPRTYIPNEVIFHRDEEAASMFFIVSGTVEVETLPDPVRLGKGAFFGELALLYTDKRTATVMAVSYLELLELDAGDFRRLLEANPQLKTSVAAEAERRLSRSRSEY